MKDECRIGVYICNCGTNIAKVVDAEAVRARVAKLPGVACAPSSRGATAGTHCPNCRPARIPARR